MKKIKIAETFIVVQRPSSKNLYIRVVHFQDDYDSIKKEHIVSVFLDKEEASVFCRKLSKMMYQYHIKMTQRYVENLKQENKEI